ASSHHSKVKPRRGLLQDSCVEMCTGVYTSTCMAFGNDNLPLPSGIMHANAISFGANGDGIDYYLLSTDPDYLGLEWREHGHYTLTSNATAPSPVENCAGSLDVQAWDGTEWIPFQFDMEWNTVDNAQSFYLSTAIGFNCHYTKATGQECKNIYESIVDAFESRDLDTKMPSAKELCGEDTFTAISRNGASSAVAPTAFMALLTFAASMVALAGM
ncbi:MAG: hypothetical protein SGARI_001152, partial [Bacillariaceae sp.]